MLVQSYESSPKVAAVATRRDNDIIVLRWRDGREQRSYETNGTRHTQRAAFIRHTVTLLSTANNTSYERMKDGA